MDSPPKGDYISFENCCCCNETFLIDIKAGHDPVIKDEEECPECTHDYNKCEGCGNGLDSFYEKEDNWGEEGKKPIWTTNWRDIVDTHTGILYGDWISHVVCPRCGYENTWDDANG